MNEVNAQSVVSAENYEQIKEMMLSNDEASVNLAITIMEQSDYEKSMIYIMCILKDCFRDAIGTVQKFKELSPVLSEKVTEHLENDDCDVTKLSFKQIYALAEKRNNQEECEFMLDIVVEELKLLMGEFGYEFQNFTEVLIKPKGWSKRQADLISGLTKENAELKKGVLAS